MSVYPFSASRWDLYVWTMCCSATAAWPEQSLVIRFITARAKVRSVLNLAIRQIYPGSCLTQGLWKLNLSSRGRLPENGSSTCAYTVISLDITPVSDNRESSSATVTTQIHMRVPVYFSLNFWQRYRGVGSYRGATLPFWLGLTGGHR